LLIWPDKVKTPRVIQMPCSTCDYFPTVADVLGLRSDRRPEPIDGVSLLPLLEGRVNQRPRPIGFQSRNQLALIDNRYKLYSSDEGKTCELYDLTNDPREERNLAAEKPEIAQTMIDTLNAWRASCRQSLDGKDY